MNEEKKKNLIGIILLAAFTALFVAGYVSGETDTVLTKASNICLECIGIG